MNIFHKTNHLNQSSNSLKLQINCAFHHDKIITNFCSNYQCLLPMCPTCVSIHAQQHKQQNTYGQFLSIQEVVLKTQNLLYKTNKSLEDLSQQYSEDYWNKQKVLSSCKQILNNHKKKLIKQIDRKFQEIQYKMTRKVNAFQDLMHDRYRQLQSQIQYVYQSLNKQRQQFTNQNERILKNVIYFYTQKKQEKIKQWMGKFKTSVNQLKKQSIRIKCNEQIFDLVKSLDYYFQVQQFSDQQNEYLITTGRQFISSNTKRKKVQSPRWSQDKQNFLTVRTTGQNRNENQRIFVINEAKKGDNIINDKKQFEWSGSKY